MDILISTFHNIFRSTLFKYAVYSLTIKWTNLSEFYQLFCVKISKFTVVQIKTAAFILTRYAYKVNMYYSLFNI